MDRINSKNVDESSGKRMFTRGDGNAASEKKATHLSPEWLNSVQEELCTVIESQDLTLAPSDHAQLDKAIHEKMRRTLNPVIEALRMTIEKLGYNDPAEHPEEELVVLPGFVGEYQHEQH